MTTHHAIICDTNAKRLAVLEVTEHHGQTWLDCARAAAFKHLRINGLRYLSAHVSNGDLIVHTSA